MNNTTPENLVNKLPTATVVITTKNRKNDLRVALKSAVIQSIPIEILVIDDASTDGTSEMVRQEFPTARVIRHEKSLGLIVSRTKAASLATGEIIFSIDDDAAFSTPETVRQTLGEFSDPRICAVAIPFIDVTRNNVVRQLAPDSGGVYLTDQFIGTAHALRRRLFIALGGYRAHLFHQGEELDFSIRALAAGYVVRLGSADPIHHYISPIRSYKRMDIYGRRNDILFTWHNVPRRYLPVRFAGLSLLGMVHGIKVRRPWNNFVGLLRGYGAVFRFWGKRAPVKPAIFRLCLRLRRKRLKLSEVEPQLNPMIPVSALTAAASALPV